MRIQHHLTLFRTTLIPAALIAFAGTAESALLVNAGKSTGTGVLVADNEGPSGENTSYQAFNGGDQETSTTGAIQTFLSTTFTGVGGSYDVGVTFTWPDTTNDNVKQAWGRDEQPESNNFHETWMGADGRAGSGGNGTDADTTTRLTFTDLPANTSFTLTSYHTDNKDMSGTFTTNLTGGTEYDIGTTKFEDPNDWAYDFSISSDGSGTASIDYHVREGGTLTESFFLINGFDLVAVPEASTALLLAFAASALLLRRRRA